MFRGKTPVVLCDVCLMSNSGSHPQGSSHGELTPGGKYGVIVDIANSQGTHHVHIICITPYMGIIDLYSSANVASHYTGKNYCICSIRHPGYCLFHHAILCSFYSRVATNREWRLLKLSVVGKILPKCKGFAKSQFWKINKELWCGDLVLKQTFQLLDQPPLCYKVVPPISFLVFFFQWLHTLIALCASKNAKLVWTAL